MLLPSNKTFLWFALLQANAALAFVIVSGNTVHVTTTLALSDGGAAVGVDSSFRESNQTSSEAAAAVPYNDEVQQVKKLGIDLGHELMPLSDETASQLKEEAIASITRIVDAGMHELELLKDRMKREYEQERQAEWERHFKEDQKKYMARIDKLASDFLFETKEARSQVHERSAAYERLKEAHEFDKPAQAASHGHRFNTEDLFNSNILHQEQIDAASDALHKARKAASKMEHRDLLKKPAKRPAKYDGWDDHDAGDGSWDDNDERSEQW